MKRITGFLVILISSWTLSAQQAHEKALLWEITGNGLTKPSYLFGTIHILCPADLIVTDVFRGKFDSTARLVLELKMDDPQLVSRTMKAASLPPGENLQSLADPADWKSIQQFVKDSVGMPMDMFLGMKPLMLESAITLKFMPCPPASWEMTLVKMAKEKSHEILGLETVEQQVAFFDKIPVKMQLKELAEEIRQYDKTREMYSTMIRLYKEQDVDRLSMLVREYYIDFSELSETLMGDRNRAWVPLITKIVREQSSFIAVGAGHLGGENGVVALLRAAHFTVRAVR